MLRNAEQSAMDILVTSEIDLSCPSAPARVMARISGRSLVPPQDEHGILRMYPSYRSFCDSESVCDSLRLRNGMTPSNLAS